MGVSEAHEFGKGNKNEAKKKARGRRFFIGFEGVWRWWEVKGNESQHWGFWDQRRMHPDFPKKS
jgi:hypothetical protein